MSDPFKKYAVVIATAEGFRLLPEIYQNVDAVMNAANKITQSVGKEDRVIIVSVKTEHVL